MGGEHLVDQQMGKLMKASRGTADASRGRISGEEPKNEAGEAQPLRPLGVWLLIAATAAAAFLLYWGSLRTAEGFGAAMPLPWWALAALFYVAERHLVDLEFRRDAHSFSLGEIPLVLGLFLCSPAGLLLAQVLGLGAALLHRRLPLPKLLFNLSTAALGVGIASTLMHAFPGLDASFGPSAWSAAFLATVVVSVVEVMLVTSAVHLSEGSLPRKARSKSLLFGLIVTVTNTSIALAAVTILRSDARAAMFLALPGIALFFCYRAYSWQRQKSERIGSLYESTRVLHRKLNSQSTAHDLLSNTRSMFRAERAELFLLAATAGGPCLQAALGPNNEFSISKPDTLQSAAGHWIDAVSKGEAVHFSPSIRGNPWGEYFSALGLHDVMIAPLQHKDDVVGGLLVANGAGSRNPYRTDDLHLLQTLANHASGSLENARLIERLQVEVAEKSYLAMHDALTALPNRTLFRERLGQAILSAARERRKAAVVLLDLDRFKEVNDTLGHQNGDLLLKEIATRLRATLRRSDTAARLSGDEFAILLPNVPNLAAASRASEKVLKALNEPFVVQGVGLDVKASLGIAIFPDHGQDADTLIQRADVAMYLAKAAYTGYEIYAADRDDYSRSRLALGGELRQAIEGHELDIHYQPKVQLSTGRVTGVEALARWTHPTEGPIPPDEFIPVAEEAGLGRELTLGILDGALRQCRTWRDQGLDLDVSVNLSARNLQLQLPNDVARLLDKHHLPPDKLVLEMTESIIMVHPVRALEVVEELNAMGVGLAIDDFGTGYSSLAYLTRLPVQEIKIDKSFVMGMEEPDNAVIVRSTVDLGSNLNLRVVAEGVETEEMWIRLQELGCDLAQGYYLSRPRSSDKLSAWLREQSFDLRIGAPNTRQPVDPAGKALRIGGPGH